MIITKVTMTGADDNTDVNELLKISEQYPYVEWGILVSRKDDKKRFPSKEWREKLYKAVSGKQINLSCHVCGDFVTEILEGKGTFFQERNNEISYYSRIQINTHAEQYSINMPLLVESLLGRKFQYIIQYDGVNGETILNGLRDAAIDAVPLFDLSHGAGVSPDEWPAQLTYTDKYGYKSPMYCGYAGGLGPDNIIDELKRIDKAVEPNAPIWIDMETKIRSNNDQDFDFDKIVQCLEAAKPYVVV